MYKLHQVAAGLTRVDFGELNFANFPSQIQIKRRRVMTRRTFKAICVVTVTLLPLICQRHSLVITFTTKNTAGSRKAQKPKTKL